MKSRRPASPPRSPHITVTGARALRDELKYLWSSKRPQVTQAVSEAAALGDRSENAEYIYGKKQLREIDRRIRFLQKRLDEIIVVERIPDDTSRIFFGAQVTLEDEDGESSTYRLVGADEFDVERGRLSIDSPVARALLKKTVGDEVAITIGGNTRHLVVRHIEYLLER